jgi:hypothetical protein
MSKKATEPILYTAQELDVIHRIIADEMGPYGYKAPGLWGRMGILASNLYRLLLREGFTCTYQPSRKQCAQSIEVVVPNDGICAISLGSSTIWVRVGGWSSPVRMDSIEQLVAYLHTLPTQCRICYYSNGAAPLFCGIGADMVRGCTHYTPRDSVIK